MERDKKFIIRKFFNEYLDLNRSKEDEQVTVDSIRWGWSLKVQTCGYLFLLLLLLHLG